MSDHEDDDDDDDNSHSSHPRWPPVPLGRLNISSIHPTVLFCDGEMGDARV